MNDKWYIILAGTGEFVGPNQYQGPFHPFRHQVGT
jgi:hypothetical protein